MALDQVYPPQIDFSKYGLLIPLSSLQSQEEEQTKGTLASQQGTHRVQPLQAQAKKRGSWVGTAFKISVGAAVAVGVGYVVYQKIYTEGYNAGTGQGFDQGVKASAKAFVRGARNHFSSSQGQATQAPSANSLGSISEGTPVSGDRTVSNPAPQEITLTGGSNVTHPSAGQYVNSEQFEQNVEEWFQAETKADRPVELASVSEEGIVDRAFSRFDTAYSDVTTFGSKVYNDVTTAGSYVLYAYLFNKLVLQHLHH
jgi:hypothetical protein